MEDANEHCPGPQSESAGKSDACEGCPNQQICANAPKGPDPDLDAIAERMNTVKHKILVLSGKGGVGKSTFSAQLAFALAAMDFQVGLLDIDICGPSIPKMLGLEGQETRKSNSGWDPIYVQSNNSNLGVMSIGFMRPHPDEAVIWSGQRKTMLIKQFVKDVYWAELDFLIVDTPPGTSDEQISIVQCLNATGVDGAVIVTTPQQVSLIDVRKEVNFCKKIGLNILGAVENMSSLCLPFSDFKFMQLTDHGGQIDVTDWVWDNIRGQAPEMLNLIACIEVFDSSGGGALKMCNEMGVPFLGKIPLDPQLSKAAEQGRSCFANSDCDVSALALKKIIETLKETSGLSILASKRASIENVEIPENANDHSPGPQQSESVGKSDACEGFPNQQICATAAIGPNPAVDAIAERMATVKHKILVLSGKGGVGKSTFSAQLAFALAAMGLKVGLVDIDICGPSIPKMLGLEGKDIFNDNGRLLPVEVESNLRVMSIGFLLPHPDEAVIWRGPRKIALIKQFLQDVNWGELDYLIVDTPPGTSDEQITIVQCLQATGLDGAIIVTTPQQVSLIDVRKGVNFCKTVGVRVLGVVENMSSLCLPVSDFKFMELTDNGKKKDVTEWVREKAPEMLNLIACCELFDSSGGGALKMCNEMGVPFLGKVPLDPQLCKAAEEGRSYFSNQDCVMSAPALKRIIERLIETVENMPH